MGPKAFEQVGLSISVHHASVAPQSIAGLAERKFAVSHSILLSRHVYLRLRRSQVVCGSGN